MIAGVDIFDISGERGCAVADQECRKISDIPDAHKPVLGRASTRLFQDFVEARYTRRRSRP
jgi:hypothetical protein